MATYFCPLCHIGILLFAPDKIVECPQPNGDTIYRQPATCAHCQAQLECRTAITAQEWSAVTTGDTTAVFAPATTTYWHNGDEVVPGTSSTLASCDDTHQ